MTSTLASTVQETRWRGAVHGDKRTVVPDPQARYFGAPLTDREPRPDDGARLGETTLEDWRGVEVVSGRKP